MFSSGTYGLTANVEHLTLTGTGNIAGYGNELSNEITGNGGSNTLMAGAGNDTVRGEAGKISLSEWMATTG